MAIDIGATRINAKYLGGQALNKVMLGATEIFPNIAGSAWHPSEIFAGIYGGYALDPRNLLTTFQDSDGNVPAIVGQPLGRISDVSGNNNHRRQTISARRPILVSGGYQCDGVDDGMTTAIDLSAGGGWTYVAALNPGADTQYLLLFGAQVATAFFNVAQLGSNATSNNTTTTSLLELEVNGAPVLNTRGSLQTALSGGESVVMTKLGSLNNASWQSVMSIGDYASFQLSGIMRREIMINRILSGQDLANAIAWVTP